MGAPIPPLLPPRKDTLLPSYPELEQEAVTEEAPCSHPELQGAAEGLAQEAQLGAQVSESNATMYQVSILHIHNHVGVHGLSTEDMIEVVKWNLPAFYKQ